MLFNTISKNKHMSSNQTSPKYSLPWSKQELEDAGTIIDDVLGTLSLEEIVQVLEKWVDEIGVDRTSLEARINNPGWCIISIDTGIRRLSNIHVETNGEFDAITLSCVINHVFRRRHNSRAAYSSTGYRIFDDISSDDATVESALVYLESSGYYQELKELRRITIRCYKDRMALL